MTDQNSLRYWVDEAIRSLGYVKADAAPKLCELIASDPHASDKSISTAYRKSGTQLSAEGKKALGLRANAFMTEEALADLTEKGRECALIAHEATMRRAAFALKHAENMAKEKSLGVTKWEAVAPATDQCPGCKRLDGQVMCADDISPTGPHDCSRDACAIIYTPIIDENFMSQDRKEPSPKPWWKFW